MKQRLIIFSVLIIFASACVSQNTKDMITFANWPYGHKSAVAITFETEIPTEKEFEEISNELKERDINATFFVVAGYFQDNPVSLDPLREFEVANLAWMQNNWKESSLTNEFQKQEIYKADLWLRENGFSPIGYRAPFLMTNEATYEILEEMGYSYDASQYFDFFPYNIGEIVEIPLSLNYDLYWDDLSMSYSMLPTYIAFQNSHEKEGLFTFYGHTNKVYENMNNFTYFLDYASSQDVWFASTGEVYEWWLKKENLELIVDNDRITVKNKGSELVTGATIKYKSNNILNGAVQIKYDKENIYAVLPPINPDSQIILNFGESR